MALFVSSASQAPQVLSPTTPVLVDTLPEAPGAAAVRVASRLLEQGQPRAALAALGDLDSDAASLMRGRAQFALGDLPAARAHLLRISAASLLPSPLQLLVQLEQGRLAAASGDFKLAVEQLLPLLQAGGALATQAAPSLMEALVIEDAQLFLQHAELLAAALSKNKSALDARSLWFDAKARAQEKLGMQDNAQKTRLQRYLEEPVSTSTPQSPPPQTTPSQEELIKRLERLVEAHRNDRALTALAELPAVLDDPRLQCRKIFAQGLAARKLRRYAQAEESLSAVVNQCDDGDLVRRASYLRAKVISIRDGLRAIAAIDEFATKYPNHSMTDDVLFWAGDLYQRRGRDVDAQKYYNRIDALVPHDDHCGEARWRLAWMAYRRGEMTAARLALSRLLEKDGCVSDRYDESRAHFWLGRLLESQNEKAEAIVHYQHILDAQPLSYYAQMSLPRLLGLQDAKNAALTERSTLAPTSHPSMPLCADSLAQEPAFLAGLSYLSAGLNSDAAAQFRAVQAPQVNRELVDRAQRLEKCGPTQAALLLIFLLNKSDAQQDAQWRLRAEFGDEFSRIPTANELALWRAAYPLAFREFLAAAEEQNHLPTYFLQALAREESVFDPFVVSWAEAYGLTQLVFVNAQNI